MNKITSITTQFDPDKERRLALAKVYRILIELAEEAENEAVDPNGNEAGDEKTEEPS